MIHLDMEKLTAQNVADIAYRYYANGGKSGHTPGDRSPDGCTYFRSDGGRCAIGAVLDHLGYTKKDLGDHNELTTVSMLFDELPGIREKFSCDVEFLESLQRAHDGSERDDEIPERIRWTCRDHGVYLR